MLLLFNCHFNYLVQMEGNPHVKNLKHCFSKLTPLPHFLNSWTQIEITVTLVLFVLSGVSTVDII